MSRRGTIITAIIIVVLVGVLVYAVSTKQTKQQAQTKAEAGAVQGQSEHWRIQLTYVPADKDMIEAPRVEYLGADQVEQAGIIIVFKDGVTSTYGILAPGNLSAESYYSIGTKQVVDKGVNDVENVIANWKVGGIEYKEYISVNKVDVTQLK